MHRLQLAKQTFEGLAALARRGVDESLSDRVEEWLRNEVVAVAEDLQKKPRFRRYATAAVDQLAAGTGTTVRRQVESVADAIVECARAMVDFARQTDSLQLLADAVGVLDAAWIREQQARSAAGSDVRSVVDTRSVVEKAAGRPWFDCFAQNEYFAAGWHLYLRNSDALLTRQFRRFEPTPPLLGDIATHMSFARISFWESRLEKGWQRLTTEGQWSYETARVTCERAFEAKFALDRSIQQLREAWLLGTEPRLRNACCTIVQVYTAYHPCAALPWADTTVGDLAPHAAMLRFFFRHTGEITEIELLDAQKARVVGHRKAQLVDMSLVRSVAAALDDLEEMYEEGVMPEDLINEARTQHRLVVVVSPRMVFWDGVKLDVDWNGKDKSWEMMLLLAARAEQLEGVDQHGLSGAHDNRGLSVRKHNLIKQLTADNRVGNSPAAELAARIEKRPKGECYLDLEPNEVKVLELGAVRADGWTVDPRDFEDIAS
ncbi:MAG: hypothetical protein NTY19_50140 [Planctomycetota bacterium]|nr:hypothetical protein [Planctomycetota bacterium]